MNSKPLSDAVRTKIIEHVFYGIGRNESCRMLRRTYKTLSSGSVSNVRDEFNNDVEANDLEWAARKFNVNELVKKLTEIGRVGTENDVDLDGMVEGTRLAKKVKDAEADPKALGSFITVVYKKALEKNMSIDDIISNCTEVQRLTEKYGPFDSVKKVWDEIGFKLGQKGAELKGTMAKLATASNELKEMFAEHETDEKELQAFISTKRFLLSIGIDLEDLEVTKVILQNLKQQKFNYHWVVSKLKAERWLDESLAKKQGDLRITSSKLEQVNQSLTFSRDELGKSTKTIAQLERTGAELVKENKRLDAEIREKKPILSRATVLEEVQAILKKADVKDPVVGVQIFAKLKRYGGAKRVLDLLKDYESIEDAIQDLKKKVSSLMFEESTLHGSISRLTSDETALAAHVKTIEKEIQNMQEEMKAFEATIAERRKTAEAELVAKERTRVLNMQNELEEKRKKLFRDLEPLEKQFVDKHNELELMQKKKTELNEQVVQLKQGQADIEKAVGVLEETLDKIDNELSRKFSLKTFAEAFMDPTKADTPSLLELLDVLLDRVLRNLNEHAGRAGIKYGSLSSSVRRLRWQLRRNLSDSA
jgi:chromosome segregation ATPase